MKAARALLNRAWTALRAASLRTLLNGAAMLLLLACLFEPRWPTTRPAYDFVIMIDITQSMNVLDYEIDDKPASRLDYVKHVLRQTVPAMPCGSRVGWGVFTGVRTLLLLAPVEVCGNYNDLIASLDMIDGRMVWTNASEIAKGLFWGLRTVKDLGGGHGIVFMTDGHESPPLNPDYRPIFENDTSGRGRKYTILDQSKFRREFEVVYDGKPGDIRGVIVGVGGDTLKPIPKKDSEGRSLGYWQPHDVMHNDIYAVERLKSANEPAPATIAAAEVAGAEPVAATREKSEHMSSLKADHLREMAKDAQLDYHRLTDAPALLKALTAPRLARPAPYRADVRLLLAGIALLLLVALDVQGIIRRKGAWAISRKTGTARAAG